MHNTDKSKNHDAEIKMPDSKGYRMYDVHLYYILENAN